MNRVFPMCALLLGACQPSSLIDGDVFSLTSSSVLGHLDSDGLHASNGDDELGIALASWGRLGSEKIAETVHPSSLDCSDFPQLRAQGTCRQPVGLHRAGLTELWQAVPGGLEQVWQASERPDGAGWLVLNLTLAEAIRWDVDPGGLGAHILGSAGGSWSYAGLKVWDAAGDPIDAWMEATQGGLSLVIRDATAVYPLTIDPTLSQDDKLVASDGAADDYFGYTVSGAGDVDNDGYDDVIIGAPQSDDNGNRSGSAYVYLGGPAGLDRGSELELQPSDAAVDDYFGRSVSGAGDVNGDGFDDVIVGAIMQINNPPPGKAYVYLGGPGGIDPASEVKLTASDELGYDWYASAVSSAGDLNDDGYDDVIVGAHRSTDNGLGSGSAYVYFGSASGVDIATEFKVIASDVSTDNWFGYSVAAAGDVDNDGYGDLIVGAPDVYSGEPGAAYVFLGSAGGIDMASETKIAPASQSLGDRFGFSVASAGDVNDDGFFDVIIGAPRMRFGLEYGAVYIFSGSGGGVDVATELRLRASDNDASDYFGFSVAGIGDANGDGYDDVVGASPEQHLGFFYDVGAAYVYSGSAVGINPATEEKLLAADGYSDAQFGFSVAGAGDVNGDGLTDILIGAPYSVSDYGSAYVFSRAPTFSPLIPVDDLAISDMGPPDDPDWEVNSAPVIAAGGSSGKFLVVWNGADDLISADDNDNQVYGQFLNGLGDEVGANDFWIGDIGLNADLSIRNTYHASVAYNATDEVFVVVFRGFMESSYTEIWAVTLDELTGAVVEGPVQVTDSNGVGASVFGPDVVWNETDNDYLVSYKSDGTIDGDWQAFSQRLDASLTEQGPDDQQVTFSQPYGPVDDLAASWSPQNNRHLVVWSERPAANLYNIWGQSINADGTVFGAPFQISAMTYYGRSPAVAFDDVNNIFLVVWSGSTDPITADGETEVFGQLVSPSGALVGGELRISQVGVDFDTATYVSGPRVTWCGAQQEYFVAWVSGDLPHSSTLETYGQRVSPLGALLGDRVKLSTTISRGTTKAAIACDALGTVGAVWISDLVILDGDELFRQFHSSVDDDGDGVPDVIDPCLGMDLDTDGDGICDNIDICPFAPGDDSDGDGFCDDVDICPGGDDSLDGDGDGVPDFCDLCPLDDPDDTDGDGICEGVDFCFGDNGTGDSDSDGICDSDDLCPSDPLNDADLDGICDGVDFCFGDNGTGDTDGDGVCDDADPCPIDNPNDTDLDGICDADDICSGDDLSGDTDGDGVCDNLDSCPLDALGDSDGDGSCDSDDLCFGDDASGDLDGDGVCNDGDPCPFSNPDDADGDGTCDNIDLCFGDDATGDTDGDGICDGSDPCPLDATNDSDGDGVCDGVDVCTGDDATGDSDADGLCDDIDLCFGDDASGDTDGDGACDDSDPCPDDFLDDSDGDGSCDSDDACFGGDASGDTDGDGVCDDTDPCPLDDPDDSDADGVCDSVDLCTGDDASGDTDGDGVCDDTDPCPLDDPDDTDGDGVCDSVDLCVGDDLSGDTDGDGVCSDLDPCPNDDPDDTDGDGVCESVDICVGDDATGDTDGDGTCDDLDPCPLDDPDDTDGDGVCDGVDACTGDDGTGDPDGDGVCSDLDPCPLDNPGDTDGDGVCDSDDICSGDDATGDVDGDGVCGDLDPCPLDFDDDSDGDGSCDDVDLCSGDDATGDVDGDGVCADLDPCPLDALDDSDGDGSCDGVDFCFGGDASGDSDGDGICDDVDVCPNDPLDDSDGDGICDSLDLCVGDDLTGDSDGDGTCDDLDPCPLDNPDDTDGDGVCDAVDLCAGDDATGDVDGDGVCGDLDPCPLDSPDDTDGDGVCDSVDLCSGDDATGDSDLDGTCDDLDPCPLDSPGDTDGDGVCDSDDLCSGDDASGDSDGDGLCDDLDQCLGDDSTGDSDLDGVCDDLDPCPLDSPDDTDGDGVCDSDDLCDGDDSTGDADGDGTCDDLDPCYGEDFLGDTDGDGVCDDLDPCPLDDPDDSDGDGVCDNFDVCPDGDDLRDSDGDGTPDACEDAGEDTDGDTDGDKTSEGCGCATSPAHSSGLGLWALLAVAMLRRRRAC